MGGDVIPSIFSDEDKNMTPESNSRQSLELVAKTNCVQEIRESKMMSKAELARKANVTVQTIDRIEKGFDCRLDTKRKIILAFGYKLNSRSKVFDDLLLKEN
jgi:DNA-binding XRE family transcriptional regulator